MALKFLFRRLKIRKYGTKAIAYNEEMKRIKASNGVSHGFHVAEMDDDSKGSMLAQREQVEDLEVCLFGAFDQQMGSGITNYLQTHLFDNKLSEHQIVRKAKIIMKKAYISTRAKVEEGGKENGIDGSATVIVMNGEKFVAASFGRYKSIICRDGVASQIGKKKKKRGDKGGWYIADMLGKCTPTNGDHKVKRSSELIVAALKVDRKTEFIILASDGVWEVMRIQEAVDLVNHTEDAQKAAECIAEEALNRLSKSRITCIVIRFH